MTEATSDQTLLRDILSGVNRLRDDMTDLKYRLSRVEQLVADLRMDFVRLQSETVHIRSDLVRYKARIDDLEDLRRIERHLEQRDQD